MTALDTMAASDMDISAIADEEWLSRRLPVKVRTSRAPVIIARSVLNDIHDHGKGSRQRERVFVFELAEIVRIKHDLGRSRRRRIGELAQQECFPRSPWNRWLRRCRKLDTLE